MTSITYELITDRTNNDICKVTNYRRTWFFQTKFTDIQIQYIDLIAYR